MKKKTALYLMLCGMVMAALLLTGCGGKKEAKTPADAIVLGVENESAKVNPLFTDEHDDAVMLIFTGLTRYNEKNELTPDLAESWQISADQKEYIFKLRQNVKWHDGQPFTAEDVKFTIDTALDKKSNSTIRERFEEIQEVSVLDPYTVKIVLKTPFRLLDAMTTGMIPKHALAGKDVNHDAFNAQPIGTGPFRLSQWQKGQAMTLEANKDFYRGAPKVAKVILKFLPDQNVRALQLETGEIDVALVDPAQVERVQKVQSLQVERVVTADYRCLMYNRQFPLWDDARVRQALNFAVDREALVKGVMLGWGKAAYGPLQLNWGNNSAVETYAYNPAKAKELLAAAGYTPGADGMLQKDGKKLTFKITTFAHDPVRVSLANALSTQFKQIGVDAVPDPREKGSFKIADMETFLLGWGSPFDPDQDTYRIFHGSDPSGQNYEHYKNAKVDAALTAARQTMNQEARKGLYAQFQQALAEDPPFNFLVYLDVAVVHNKSIGGFKARTLGHHGAGYTWNVEEWSKTP